MPPGNKKMTTAIDLSIGQRTADWLKDLWPVDTAKHVARELDIDLRTAEGYCAGNRPANRAWDAMVIRWGKEFLAFVYRPYFDWARHASLEIEIETIQARLNAVSQKVRSRHVDQNDPRDARAMLRSAPGKSRGVVRKPRGKAGTG